MSNSPDVVVEYYETAFREADRLTGTALGRLEFERTRSLLRRHLPPAPGRLLDVGGATGIHAAWLAVDGYTVDLFDPVPRHVAAAASVPGITAQVADARDLPAADGSADAVVLLGPLYHLTARADRLDALAEAHRVTRPGGVLAAAAIGRFADALSLAVDGTLDDARTARVLGALAAGDHPVTPGFTAVHLHTVAELTTELTDAGWLDIRVFGIEGPTWPAVRNLPFDADITQHVRVADILDAHAEATAISSHLLAIGRRPV